MDMRSSHLWRGMRHTEASRTAICSCWSPFIVMITGIIRIFNSVSHCLYYVNSTFNNFMWYTVVYHGVTYTPFEGRADGGMPTSLQLKWHGTQLCRRMKSLDPGDSRNFEEWEIVVNSKASDGFSPKRSCLNKKFHQNTSKLTLFEEDLEVGELVSFTRHYDNWEYGTEQHPVWNHGKTQFCTS